MAQPATKQEIQNLNDNKMTENKIPTVETQMLIRKPVTTVFQAFIDPTIRPNFGLQNQADN
jgi:hypothetical protein